LSSAAVSAAGRVDVRPLTDITVPLESIRPGGVHYVNVGNSVLIVMFRPAINLLKPTGY
jgi:hypothetical protein